ncbi:two-component sensor histidine kinase [Gracilibacillus boraciitolerans JCM 21714]|uniref:histidine kinase n=1 Tax=Gracilibacillus boraciitolerans JCM 21714 TaxID=1298598 RepID=W4VIK9_9BACI|nr:ATP-binding protein [Gracilibacillus boraciitolerans]GAE93245.1 two-component sensor histidine kinase [Gracilibacillus boraciitolerans JCM 21714]
MPIEKELEHIRHYITIQNIRYGGDRIDFIEEVDKGLLDKEILKLLLQPIIENAVFHGVEPKIGKGLIKIIGKLEGSFVRFTISDNGVGIEDLNLIEQGFGMKNVRERIELYYGSTSEFIVKSEVNAGTTITIRFPLNKEGHAHA